MMALNFGKLLGDVLARVVRVRQRPARMTPAALSDDAKSNVLSIARVPATHDCRAGMKLETFGIHRSGESGL
jgi:hypothetical protein